MYLQRQHFLLSYFKTLSVGPAGVELTTSRVTADAQLTEPPVRGTVYHLFPLNFSILLQGQCCENYGLSIVIKQITSMPFNNSHFRNAKTWKKKMGMAHR